MEHRSDLMVAMDAWIEVEDAIREKEAFEESSRKTEAKDAEKDSLYREIMTETMGGSRVWRASPMASQGKQPVGHKRRRKEDFLDSLGELAESLRAGLDKGDIADELAQNVDGLERKVKDISQNIDTLKTEMDGLREDQMLFRRELTETRDDVRMIRDLLLKSLNQ